MALFPPSFSLPYTKASSRAFFGVLLCELLLLGSCCQTRSSVGLHLFLQPPAASGLQAYFDVARMQRSNSEKHLLPSFGCIPLFSTVYSQFAWVTLPVARSNRFLPHVHTLYQPPAAQRAFGECRDSFAPRAL
ncbi:hypothetical protein C8Q79DRAFT_332688 [Trametes meyenii]|nr:hypothetical protein C8Q79DRAFT_332688 [Trametes meyenii]